MEDALSLSKRAARKAVRTLRAAKRSLAEQTRAYASAALRLFGSAEDLVVHPPESSGEDSSSVDAAGSPAGPCTFLPVAVSCCPAVRVRDVVEVPAERPHAHVSFFRGARDLATGLMAAAGVALFSGASGGPGGRGDVNGTLATVGLALLHAPVVFGGVSHARVARSSKPQAMLLLGGDRRRERLAAELAAGRPVGVTGGYRTESALARACSDLPCYISSAHGNVWSVFTGAGVAPARLRVDSRATDTVTNFTTLADDLRRDGHSHVLMLTSSYHESRAALVGRIVLGSRGIAVSTAPLPSALAPEEHRETFMRTLRDAGRAVLWLATGRTGATFFGRVLHPERFAGYGDETLLPLASVARRFFPRLGQETGKKGDSW